MWFPEATPPSPEVVFDPAGTEPVSAVPGAGAEGSDEPSSSALIAFLWPVGAVTGAVTWLPEPIPRLPEVVRDPAVPESVSAPDGADVRDELAPRPLTVLPSPAGAPTGAVTWLPEPTPRSPEVLSDPAVPESLPAGAEGSDEPAPVPLSALPSPAGARTGAVTWLPEPTPRSPEVVSDPAVPESLPAGAEGSDEPAPVPLTALPSPAGALTGAVT
jgi:hypothetical protein